jgi:hypothetical protein
MQAGTPVTLRQHLGLAILLAPWSDNKHMLIIVKEENRLLRIRMIHLAMVLQRLLWHLFRRAGDLVWEVRPSCLSDAFIGPEISEN